MKCTKYFLLILIFLTRPALSQAVHWETYVGYGVLIFNEKNLDAGITVRDSIDYVKTSEYYKGALGGIRLGYTNLGLAVGLDFSTGRMQSDETSLAPLLWGVFASYKLPFLFRAYGVFIPPSLKELPFNKVVVSDSSGTTHCSESWGGKMGLSYLSIPFLSVNFEYQPVQIAGADCRAGWSHSFLAYLNLIF